MKAERIRRGWSQQRLAVEAGVGYADICRIECGWLRPYPGQAEKIARVLGIGVESLLEECDEEGSDDAGLDKG
ncbi:MAG: helix-turn-helix domain-containing protein [Bacillota bacterium]